MKFILVTLVVGLVLTPFARAKESPHPEPAKPAFQIQALLAKAQRLQNQVEKLEHALEFPNGDQLAVYLSSRTHEPSFTPTEAILELDGKPMIHLQFSDREHVQLSQSLYRLVSSRLSPGFHTVRATVSGENAAGILVVETVERRFEKSERSVLMELSVGPEGDEFSYLKSHIW